MLTSVVKFSTKPFVGVVIALGLMAVSCEDVKDDVLPEGRLEQLNPQTLYTVPGEPTVIDLLEGVTIPEPVNLQVTKAPAAGELSMVANSLAMYELPSSRSNSSSDDFEMRMETDSMTYVRTFEVQVTDRVGYPIGEQGAVYDRGGVIKPEESLTVDVLANDREGGRNLQIEVPPAHGSAIVTDDMKITYTADSDFLGLVDVFYKVEFPDGKIGRANVRFAVSNE